MNIRIADMRALALGGLLLALSSVVVAAPGIDEIQQRWDHTNFELDGKSRIEAFESLVEMTEEYKAEHPGEVRGVIWSGIVRSSFAGARGGLGALGLAKKAKRDFEQALAIDPTAMKGSAYTSLGTLYFRVPGWPVGFGDDKRAESLLQQGLDLDPDGMDSNFFYAEYLRSQGRMDAARVHYRRAQQAAPAAGREVAYTGRQREIASGLAALEAGDRS